MAIFNSYFDITRGYMVFPEFSDPKRRFDHPKLGFNVKKNHHRGVKNCRPAGLIYMARGKMMRFLFSYPKLESNMTFNQ
jgi:hypothetical protein